MLAVAAAAACSRTESAAGGSPPSTTSCASKYARILEWDLGAQPWGQGRAVVVVPGWGGPGARFPVLVALHGRGEALKGAVDGAMGWPRDYALLRAIDRLHTPPLREADYEGLADQARMADANASLAGRPFGGVIVACPWLPDLHPAATGDIAAYSRFLVDELLPRVRQETPALGAAEATGIDGVSLGGVVALRVGLTCPESFAAVGGIQPALSEGQNAEWTALARAARATTTGFEATSPHEPRRLLSRGHRRSFTGLARSRRRARFRRRTRSARLHLQPGARVDRAPPLA